MKIKCITAVENAIGRTITKAEAAGIEARVVKAQQRLAARNPKGWAAMPREGQLREAARAAAKDLIHEAELKETRAALAVQAHLRNVPEVEQAGKNGFKVIRRKLDQVDAYIKGVHREYLMRTLDTIDFATRQDRGSLVGRGVRWIANLESPEKTLAFVREVFGKDSGDAGAKAAAKAWLDSIENMRQRFNAGGGDVRKLIYGYLPQPHDAGRVREAGIKAWVGDVIRYVDRDRYVTPSGRHMTDGELSQALEEAWRTIASDGWSKIEPGQFRGDGTLADAGSQSRVIHFKDPEHYVEYLGKYGHGTVTDALSSHIGMMAKHIGLVEQMGPNPTALFRTMHDTAMQGGGTDRVAGIMTTNEAWKTLAGDYNNPQSASIARINQGIRNVEVYGKLQSAFISAITDIPNYYVTLGYNRQGFWQGTVNLVRAFGSESRHFADVAGLMADSKIGDMHRWSEANLGYGWTSQMANATMKASLLSGWTDGVRRAFSITMMAGMGKIAHTPWEALDKGDRARLTTKGWTPEEWGVMNKASTETWRNTQMLTPAGILSVEGVDANMRQRVVSRMLGMMVDESEFASPAPDLTTRTLQAGGLQKGTGNGELWRHLMLFKGFPFAMMFRHWDRIFNGDLTPAGRVAYTSALMTGTTLFGAIALQLGDLLAGRDPRPADNSKFWLAAMSKGGGMGFLGDMLLNGVGRQGQSGASAAIGGIAGPVFGSGFELAYDVIFENIREAAQGKDTHIGAETMRWARGHMPLVNLWYLKTALDQAALNDLQELLSPGYLDRVRNRMESQWGSTYWWAPQKSGVFDEQGFQGPQRAPDLSAAFGQQ